MDFFIQVITYRTNACFVNHNQFICQALCFCTIFLWLRSYISVIIRMRHLCRSLCRHCARKHFSESHACIASLWGVPRLKRSARHIKVDGVDRWQQCCILNFIKCTYVKWLAILCAFTPHASFIPFERITTMPKNPLLQFFLSFRFDFPNISMCYRISGAFLLVCRTICTPSHLCSSYIIYSIPRADNESLRCAPNHFEMLSKCTLSFSRMEITFPMKETHENEKIV